MAQIFSWEFCEISKNTFFTEHLRTTASGVSRTFLEKLRAAIFENICVYLDGFICN